MPRIELTMKTFRTARQFSPIPIADRMIPEISTSSRSFFPDGSNRGEQGWSDEIWSAVVGSLDAALRYCYGIHEFTDDPECVLRLGLSVAQEPVTLPDGTAIDIGDPIGSLHFWNEHLPRYSEGGGPELGWAAEMRRRVAGSLKALAEHVENDPDWRIVHAFRGHAAFSSRAGILQLHRVTRRLGFQWVPGGPSTARALAGSITGYGLTRVHNPAALSRQAFFRRVHEIWISRAMLLKLYGRPGLVLSVGGTERQYGNRGKE
jgi:hypothetical protein